MEGYPFSDKWERLPPSSLLHDFTISLISAFKIREKYKSSRSGAWTERYKMGMIPFENNGRHHLFEKP
jgi:hypothetical protein